jgi:hypothetical protein
MFIIYRNNQLKGSISSSALAFDKNYKKKKKKHNKTKKKKWHISKTCTIYICARIVVETPGEFQVSRIR